MQSINGYFPYHSLEGEGESRMLSTKKHRFCGNKSAAKSGHKSLQVFNKINVNQFWIMTLSLGREMTTKTFLTFERESDKTDANSCSNAHAQTSRDIEIENTNPSRKKRAYSNFEQRVIKGNEGEKRGERAIKFGWTCKHGQVDLDLRALLIKVWRVSFEWASRGRKNRDRCALIWNMCEGGNFQDQLIILHISRSPILWKRECWFMPSLFFEKSRFFSSFARHFIRGISLFPKFQEGWKRFPYFARSPTKIPW